VKLVWYSFPPSVSAVVLLHLQCNYLVDDTALVKRSLCKTKQQAASYFEGIKKREMDFVPMLVPAVVLHYPQQNSLVEVGESVSQQR